MRPPSGCPWYLQGLAGKVYNLINGPDDTLNTLLVPANLTDASHTGNGTYHGTLAIRHKEHLVETTVDAEGNLTGTSFNGSCAVRVLCHALTLAFLNCVQSPWMASRSPSTQDLR